MKTSLVRFYTKDGIELVGLLYEPESGTQTVLVHVHGMAGNFYENSFLDYIAQELTVNNIAFLAFNNRGCELLKDLVQIDGDERKIIRIGNAYELFDDCILDIQAAIDFVSAKGYNEIHLSGHSLGAPKVAYYTAENNNNRLKSVIFLSPSDMVGLTRADKNYERDVAMAKKMIAEGRGSDLLPFPVLWDESPLSAQTYLSLGMRESKVAIFNFHDPMDKLELLQKITIPSLSVMGKSDDALVTSIEETMGRIKEAMALSSKVETVILGDADHGYTKHGSELAKTLKDWIMAV